MIMKNIALALLIMVIMAGLVVGCGKNDGGSAPPVSADTESRDEGTPSTTTKDGIVGTWQFHSGLDQNGKPMDASTSYAPDFSVTFDAKGGFSGMYRSGSMINSTFSGTCVYPDTGTDNAPDDFVYLVTIDKNSIKNSGPMKFGGDKDYLLNLVFHFSDKNGEKLLYEEKLDFYLN